MNHPTNQGGYIKGMLQNYEQTTMARHP